MLTTMETFVWIPVRPLPFVETENAVLLKIVASALEIVGPAKAAAAWQMTRRVVPIRKSQPVYAASTRLVVKWHGTIRAW